MKRIYKYTIPVKMYYTLNIYKGFTVLSIQAQGDCICMWAAVDITAEMVTVDLCILATGQSMDEQYPYYGGTVQTHEGMFVWHIFSNRLLDPWNPKHIQS